MLIDRASVVVRAFATVVLAAIIGALLVVPSASAVEAPDASVFAIQTNGPNGLVTLGDWYTSNVAGAGGGYHYIRFTVPCGWPGGLPVYVDLFSPEMNRVSGAIAQSEEPNGAYDSTQFELYGPGATVGPGYASPAAGTGIAGTRTTYQPGGAGVPEAWIRYATLSAPVTCGNYVVRTEVLTADPLNPAGTGDDQNGWRIRVGTDSDLIPTNAPPANYDNPDGLVGTNDEITLGLDQASFQQDSGASACQTFYEYVSPGQASIVFHNFDMDGNTRIRYYAPSDATYVPDASSGGTLGTLSVNGQWNGGTLATRVGDSIPTPESGWWRFVTCISTQNQFIQEGEAGRAAYYVQPPTPALTIAKSDGLANVAPGQTITYAIDVANVAAGATAGAANNVVVHDLLPAGVTYLGCGSPVPAQGTWACSHSGGDVTFTQNGWIEAGDAAQLTVTARVNQGTSGSIVNTATADYTDQIGNPFAQVSGSDTDTIVPSADLEITKTDGVASVTAGTSTTYSITLTNNGPTDEPTGVVITDTIPAGVTPSESEADCGIAAGVFSCTTSSTLAAGASVSYQLTLAVPANSALASLSNTASITSAPIPDPNAANDSATDVDAVTISADLSIVKADSADPVDPGDAFSYTLTVTNDGSSDAAGLMVGDTVPAVFAVTSVTSGAGSCGHAGNVATCTRPVLPAGASWVITIAVDVDPLAAGGLYTDTATVSATSLDPVPANDSDSEGTLVTPVGDLAVTKSDGVGSVVPGTSTTYTITLTNLGPSTVPAGAVVSDTIPANTIGSELEGDCAILAGVFSCTTSAPLVSGASVAYQLTLLIDPTYPGSTLVNTAGVTSSTIPDPFPANDAATDTDSITAADLSITKTDGVGSVEAGTSTTYTITVINNGPSALPAGAVVSDPIPADTVGSELEGDCAVAAGTFTCTTSAPIASGGSVSYQLTLMLSPAYPLVTLTNTASITSSPLVDTVSGNDSATDVDAVTISADLSIAKTDSADPVDPGDSLSYTLTVTNNGPSDASGLMVSDTVPAGFTITSVTSGSGACGFAGQVATCTRASLPAGNSWVITISIDVDLFIPGGLYTDTATVSVTSPDPVPGNDSDSEGTLVTPVGDLEVTKTDGAATVAPGASTTYMITVTNLGPSDVPAGVMVSDAIPANTTGFESEIDCAIITGVFSCTTSAVLVSGASVVYQLTLAVAAGYPGATLVNTASVTSSIPDPFPANDSASDTDAIAGVADLSVTKTDGVASVVAGTSTTYTITITNNGPSTVPAGAVVSDPIPAGTAGSESEPGCTISAGVFACTTSSPIASGGSTSYQLTLTLPPGYALPTLTNTATIVSSPYPDPNPGNDSATDVDTVTTSADLSVVKTDAPDPVPVGAPLTYSLVVMNAGPSNALSVSVADTLPAGVTFVSATPSQGSCAGTVTCTLGTILAGATATITITVTPTAAGAISNTATVSSPTPDPVPGNNADTEPTTVVASADLSVTKTDFVAAVDAGTSTVYTLTLTNNGPSDVPAGIVLTDAIPANTVASETEADCIVAAATFTCTTTAALGNGASVVYRLTLAIDPAYPSTTLVNTIAIASSPVADPALANNAASDTDTVNPIAADLSIVKTDSADPVLPGSAFSYTIAVTNAGPDDAEDVVLTDPVPGVLTVTAATSSGTGTCVAALNAVMCTIDPLAAGATWTVTIQVSVPMGTPAGMVTNTATVSGVGNTDTTNDVAIQTTTIGEPVGVADLAVAKAVDDASPQEGDAISYDVTVTNEGPDDASDVLVVDALPAGLTFITATTTQGSYDEATGEWSVGPLSVGVIAGLRIRARVDQGTAGTTIVNRAGVAAMAPSDPSDDDDAATAPIEVEEGVGSGGGGDGSVPGGGTAFTGFPGARGLMGWMLGLALLGLAALGLAGRRRTVAVVPSAPDAGGEAPDVRRFLAEPFYFFKE